MEYRYPNVQLRPTRITMSLSAENTKEEATPTRKRPRMHVWRKDVSARSAYALKAEDDPPEAGAVELETGPTPMDMASMEGMGRDLTGVLATLSTPPSSSFLRAAALATGGGAPSTSCVLSTKLELEPWEPYCWGAPRLMIEFGLLAGGGRGSV